MKSKLTILILTLLVIWSTAQTINAADYTGVVTVDSAQARPGETCSVQVWLRNNNTPISAITIPLEFASPDLHLDSVVLNNTIWGQDFSGFFVIDNDAGTVRITALPADIEYPLPTVSTVDAVVAELFFSLAGVVAAERIPIDSIYKDSLLSGGVHIFTRIDVSDNTGSAVLQPDFVPGEIKVLSPTAVDDDLGNLALPTVFELAQNYPNPFNPVTTIGFSLPRAGAVSLDIFNILGQQVVNLVDRRMEAGWHQVEFDAAAMPSGIYFYRLVHSEGSATRKMILVK